MLQTSSGRAELVDMYGAKHECADDAEMADDNDDVDASRCVPPAGTKVALCKKHDSGEKARGRHKSQMQHPAWGSFAQSEPHGGQPALTRLRSIWSALLTTQFLSERVASDLLDHGPRPPDDECLAASSRSELRRSPPELSAPLHQRLWLSRAGRWSTRLYFTATTFATIGFGDLKPARPEASTEEDHEKTIHAGRFFLGFSRVFRGTT